MTKKNHSTIVFVRHAHRDTSDRTLDNGLSEKGRKQAEKLAELYKSGELPEGKTFWTSPKQRCIETLAPLSSAAGCRSRIEPLLDEQLENETHGRFRHRIKDLIAKVSMAESPVYLCSHGDLIPEAITALAGVFVDLGKGDTVILEKHGENWRIL